MTVHAGIERWSPGSRAAVLEVVLRGGGRQQARHQRVDEAGGQTRVDRRGVAV
jgi:hypothetical protein